MHAHGSLVVWDKPEPVARGAGHHPGPASRWPSAVASPAPGQGQGTAAVPSAPSHPCRQPLAVPGRSAAGGQRCSVRFGCLAARRARDPGKLAGRKFLVVFSFICKPEPLLPEFPLSAISFQLTGAGGARPLWPGSPFPPPIPKPILAARWPPPGSCNGAAPFLPRLPGTPPSRGLGCCRPGHRVLPAPAGARFRGAREAPGRFSARGPGAAGRGGAPGRWCRCRCSRYGGPIGCAGAGRCRPGSDGRRRARAGAAPRSAAAAAAAPTPPPAPAGPGAGPGRACTAPAQTPARASSAPTG